VRTLVDGRLRAAKRLELQGDLPKAIIKLANQRDLSNPSFDTGSDRFRIASTRAGLDLLGARIGQRTGYWAEFIEQYSWANDWLKSRAYTSINAVWAGVP
jgi:hypothetical protein